MSDQTISAHGVTLTLTTSAGVDGAPLVFVDTAFDLDTDTGEGPGIRVYINDDCVHEGVPYLEPESDDTDDPDDEPAVGASLGKREEST